MEKRGDWESIEKAASDTELYQAKEFNEMDKTIRSLMDIPVKQEIGVTVGNIKGVKKVKFD